MQRRILIVEDDPLIGLMLEELIEALGFASAGVVQRVETALERVRACDFDAVIIDVHLADGETSGPIAAALNAAAIPFLVSTGGFVKAPLPAWAGHPVLLKPFTRESLEAALESIGLTVSQNSAAISADTASADQARRSPAAG